MLSDATTACRAYHTASAVVWSAWGSWGLWAFMALVLPSTQGKSINLTEVWPMDDTGCRGFFRTGATYHRQYESAPCLFIEGRRLHDIAQQFGYRRPRCARWSAGFVPKCKLARSPPWATDPGRPQRQPQGPEPAVPETTVIADARALSLAPGRRLHARRGGISSCPCWPVCASINWSAKPAIRAPRWCPRPVRC